MSGTFVSTEELRESVSYPGELIERVRGVRLHQADRELQLITREGEWVIRWGEGLAREIGRASCRERVYGTV